MEWIVKIQDDKNQRIKITFDPMAELIHFYGECKMKNNEWIIFSESQHGMIIELQNIQEMMEIAVIDMRKRLKEYNNVAEGFSVLKEIEFKEE